MASHAITNYLLASVEGRFAAQNIANQLLPGSLPPLEIIKTRDTLSKIQAWSRDLCKRTPLISAQWSEPESFEAMKALDLLRGCKSEIAKVALEVEDAFSQLEETVTREGLVRLVAAFGRYAYARENYIHGFIEFGSALDLPELVLQYNRVYPIADEDVQLTAYFLEGLRKSEIPDQDLLDVLALRGAKLAGTFRTHVHDINQLLAPFQGGVSYGTLEISSGEGQAWAAAGFGPSAAGYWRAFGIAPDDAAAWTSLGVSDAGYAAEWMSYGFTTTTCREWFVRGFPPHIARRWQATRLGWERIDSYLERGINDPEQIPAGEGTAT